MARAIQQRFAPFLGVMSGIDRRFVQPPYASDALNTIYEDGSLGIRPGFRQIVGTQSYKTTTMDALKMFDYAQGIVSGSDYQTYLTVERYGSSTSNLGRLMLVNTTTGARTKVVRNKSTNSRNRIHLGGATGGTYTLTVTTADGVSATTGALNWNDVLGTVDTAVEALANVGALHVTTVVSTGGFQFTWDGAALAATNVTVTLNSSLTGTTSTPVGRQVRAAKTESEVMLLAFTLGDSGVFTFNFYGQTVVISPPSAGFEAANILASLLTLSNVFPGDVDVLAYPGGVLIYWGGRYLGDNLVASISNDLTGSGVTLTTITDGYEATYSSDGTSAVPVLPDAYHHMLTVDSTVYGFCFSAGDEVPATSEATPLWTVTLGDPYSFTAIKPPVAPSDVTDKATVKYRRRPGSDVLGYGTWNWAGLADPADSTLDETVFTVMATSAGAAAVTADVTVSAVGPGSLLVPFASITAGNQDLTYRDCIAFTMRRSVTTLRFDTRTVQVYLKDTSGTRVDLDTKVYVGGVDPDGTLTYYVFCRFPPGKTRANWTATKHFGMELNVTDALGGEKLVLSPVKIGGMPGLFVPERDWQLGYAFKVAATGLISGVGGTITLQDTDLRGDAAFPGVVDDQGRTDWLGVIPTLTLNGSSNTAVDLMEIVVRQESATDPRIKRPGEIQGAWGQYRTVDEVAESSSVTYVFQTESAVFNQKPAFTEGVFEYDDIVGAANIHGATLWLFRRNHRLCVRYSAVGDPLNLVKTDNTDLDILDPNEGANFVLSDQYNDQPVAAFQTPNGCVIGAVGAVYAQNGSAPLAMSPVYRLPGTMGVCGPDAMKLWRDQYGNPAVVYVTPNADLVNVIPLLAVGDPQDRAYQPDEMSIDIHGHVRDFLTQGSSTVNADRMLVLIDTRGDSMLVAYVDRILVLTRKTLIDGRRAWAPQRYNMGPTGSSWLKGHFKEDVGYRLMRIDGSLDEIWYDSSDNFSQIVPTWIVPASMSAGSDYVQFTSDPVWADGSGVVFRKDGNGFFANRTYYTLAVGLSNRYKFYDTYANAIAGGGTGLVDITGTTILFGAVSEGRDNFQTLESAGYDAYWESPDHDDGNWWNLTETVVDRDNLDDLPMVSIYADRMDIGGTRTDDGGTLTTPVSLTCAVGKQKLWWPRWLRCQVMRHRVTLPENSSKVRTMDSKRVQAQEMHHS